MSQSTIPDQIRPRPLIACLNCATHMCHCKDRRVCINICGTAPRQLCLCYYKCVCVNTGVCLTQLCLFKWKLCLINSRYIVYVWNKADVSKLMQACMCKTCFCVKTDVSVILRQTCLYKNRYVCIKQVCLYQDGNVYVSKHVCTYVSRQVCLYQDRWDCIKTGESVSRSVFVSRLVSLYQEVCLYQDRCVCFKTGVSVSRQVCLYQDTGVFLSRQVCLYQEVCINQDRCVRLKTDICVSR